uniref:F-box domain-containing protein n=1 Tax=Aegilops tauschii TaxID=37682 RepID=M8C5T2_AEGTA
MALPAIPDELLVDIFLRLPPPGQHRFHPAVRPHPSVSAASAVALAADFSFAFLPATARNWSVREVRDGRVLLDRSCLRDAGDGLEALFKEMVVCDPLHRQYLLLPAIPDDLAASVVGQLLVEGHCFNETFLVPPGNDDEEAAAATEEEGTSFRVIWMVLLQAKSVAAVFSSCTGKWRAFSSELLPGFVLSTWMVLFVSRHYAHGRFYWVSGSTKKLPVLDIQRMEFSMADHH